MAEKTKKKTEETAKTDAKAETPTKPKKTTKLKQSEALAYYQAAIAELSRRHDRKFMQHYIKIVNKDGEQVPFVINEVQEKIDNKIKELEDQGLPVRIIVLKARQEGVSTYTQGKILCRTVKNKNRNALVVAHRDDSTTAIFEKAKYMYNHLPGNVKPLQRASNTKELIFDKPTHYHGKEQGLNSKIKVQTAGSGDIGRSDTYHYVHLSEFAFYSGDPEATLTGILNSVPDIPGTIVLIESTANGMNAFKELWDKAEAGESDFIPMFFAWHDYPSYQKSVTEEERIEIMSSLDEYEQSIVDLYNLSAEQIAWYRWKLRNGCSGNKDLMKQENPSFPKESFLSTGRPVFNSNQILMRIEQLKKIYAKNPPKKGSFTFEWSNPETRDKIKDSSIKFVEGFSNSITIYEGPKNGYPYVIGGDTAGDGADAFTGTVINNATGKRVVTLHGKLDPDTYTHQMYCLGKYYNNALISIEVNFDIYAVKELERLKYRNQYKREIIDEIGHKKQYKYGWKTDGNTRPLIISNEIVLIRDNIELFTDIAMLNEAITFVYDKNGRPDAESGKHDDVLFSDMIANASRTQMRFTVDKNLTLEFPANMSEEEKERAKANMEFESKYVDMLKYRRKK